MIDKEKLLEYINENFNIDAITYGIIDDLCYTFKDDIKSLITILNNNRIDITLKELEDNNIYITKSELILENKYIDIMSTISDILELCDLDKNMIEKKLNENDILQLDLDYILLKLIDIIRGE